MLRVICQSAQLAPGADLEGGEPVPLPTPLGRSTDAITAFLISENGTV